MAGRVYRFDDFTLDTHTAELRHDDLTVHVEPLVFDLLNFFCANPGRVISRTEIINAVWDGRFVSDAAVSGGIKFARKALDDSGEEQRFIKTVRGRGFLFAPDVVVEDKELEPRERPHRPESFQPSLVVLPFVVVGGSPHHNDVASGLADHLTSVLTRIPLLAISSRTTSLSLRDKSVTPELIRDTLGVSYMIEGSIQPLGETVSVNIQLVETRNGFQLWSKRFEEQADSLSVTALLDKILPQLEPQIVRAIFNDLQESDTGLSSRQLLLQAIGAITLKNWHQTSFAEIAGLLRQSIALEPQLPLSHAWLALILGIGHRVGLVERSDDTVSEVLANAETALELDSMDSNVLGVAGCAIADIGQPDRALPILQKAIDLNPNNAQAVTALGSALFLKGELEAAIQNLEHGIFISPMDSRLGVWRAFLAGALMAAGRLDEALTTLQDACRHDDKIFLPRVLLTAVHIQRNDKAAAQQALNDCLRLKPDLSYDEMKLAVGRKLARRIQDLRQELEA